MLPPVHFHRHNPLSGQSAWTGGAPCNACMPRTRLQVAHGVPVVLQHDHRVCCGQVQAQAAHVRGQQHDRDAGVGIEALGHLKALPRLHPAHRQLLWGTGCCCLCAREHACCRRGFPRPGAGTCHSSMQAVSAQCARHSPTHSPTHVRLQRHRCGMQESLIEQPGLACREPLWSQMVQLQNPLQAQGLATALRMC